MCHMGMETGPWKCGIPYWIGHKNKRCRRYGVSLLGYVISLTIKKHRNNQIMIEKLYNCVFSIPAFMVLGAASICSVILLRDSIYFRLS